MNARKQFNRVCDMEDRLTAIESRSHALISIAIELEGNVGAAVNQLAYDILADVAALEKTRCKLWHALHPEATR